MKLDILLNGEIGGRAFASSSTRTRPTPARGRWRRSSKSTFRARCSRCPFRRRSAARSSPGRRSRPCARTCLAKCYGGDITRKKKLLEKQKEGKKRMRQLGSRGGAPTKRLCPCSNWISFYEVRPRQILPRPFCPAHKSRNIPEKEDFL